jgi:hypothetical protein
MIFKNTRGNDFFLSEYSPRVYKPAPRPTPPRHIPQRKFPPSEMLAPTENHDIIHFGQNNDSLLKNMNEKDRIKFGKLLESEVLNKLDSLGKIEIPTAQEDMQQKIDGFITFTDPDLKAKFPNRTSIQIKKRTQSGNDILFEIERNFDRRIEGRDIQGNSVLYVVSQQSGTIGIFLTEKLKRIALSLEKAAEEKLDIFLYKNSEQIKELGIFHTLTKRSKLPMGLVMKSDGVELRVTEGNPEGSYNEGERKLIAFIPFRVGDPLKII